MAVGRSEAANSPRLGDSSLEALRGGSGQEQVGADWPRLLQVHRAWGPGGPALSALMAGVALTPARGPSPAPWARRDWPQLKDHREGGVAVAPWSGVAMATGRLRRVSNPSPSTQGNHLGRRINPNWDTTHSPDATRGTRDSPRKEQATSHRQLEPHLHLTSTSSSSRLTGPTTSQPTRLLHPSTPSPLSPLSTHPEILYRINFNFSFFQFYRVHQQTKIKKKAIFQFYFDS